MMGFDSPQEFIDERNDLALQSYLEPGQRAEFTRMLEERGLVENYEYQVKRRDGTPIWVSENVRVVRDAAGAISCYEGSVQDVTARKVAAQALVESEQRLGFLNLLGEATRALSEPREIMATVTRLLGVHLGVRRCAYAEVHKDGEHFTVPGDYAEAGKSLVGDYRLPDFGAETLAAFHAGRTVIHRNVDAELTAADGGDAFRALGVQATVAQPLLVGGQLVAIMAVHDHEPRAWTIEEIALVKEVSERCWSIIERARVSLVLRKSEEHLRLVIAASNDGVFEHEYAGEVLTWSERMYEMLGLERGQFSPSLKSFNALLHPDDRGPFQKTVRDQMSAGGRYTAKLRLRRKDGSYGEYWARGYAVADADGQPLRLIGCVSDLTILARAERKLVEQAELLDLAHDAIMVRDMEDRVQYWNRGAETLYGWNAAEVLGKTSATFLHREDAAAIAQARATVMERGEWSGECKHLRKDGAGVVVRSRWTLVRDEAGAPKAVLIINTDVTEQKKVEEQFLRAQRLESIGTLASGVAHDLNNILVPIMMVAPILRGECSESERNKFLDIVEASAQRGASIVKQVLTFARGTDGDRILLQPIYLVQEIAKIAQETFPKRISLRTRYPEDAHSLEADPTQLHQVLLNLCINARDAMPEGGVLTLEVANFEVDEHYASMTPGATVGPHVMLRVSDTGTGIPSDLLNKIFDPFFTTKEVGVGTGLGLSTVLGIVKSHGGFMNVLSEPGKTSFEIFLPATHGPVVPEPALEEADPARTRRNDFAGG